ncbi:hypothetical protein GALMADRAFT_66531 [Galerina marginata CBS 339.88]|uniref:Uncharacterized protein n=1 Tax=Galerina marginata (strain CBS 339.88) TaxID=685588 RepID=A0A067TDX0_GALM3|nr:hypothetical protein GALMADRAFT_66531 [Galerina marginata CBS 339.88]
MLFILACLYFFHGTISAAPISNVLRDAITPDFNSPSSQCPCPDQQRSLWDILWSCLATIFACTWVSVHPNIPPSGEKWWKTALRRLELMFWAVIAPELIILWAMKQFFGARAMVKEYWGHGWTKTHAYFIQMGGFTLYEGGTPKGVLLPGEMQSLLIAGKIDLPQITEEEIRDRSKGDGLSKALVIGQTTWFVAQCIVRRAQGLILTELELVTGAFAALNGVMYFLWWNKPLDVRCPVPVHILDEPRPVGRRFKFKATQQPQQPGWFSASLFSPCSLKLAITHWPWDAIFSLMSVTYCISANLFSCSVIQIRQAHLKTVMKAVVFSLFYPLKLFYTRLLDIADLGGNSYTTLTVPSSVSTVFTFYANTDFTSDLVDDLLIPSFTWTIAALFGSLHCAAWFFAFPSHAELILWRVCSALISIIPLGLLLFFMAIFAGDNMESFGSGKSFEVVEFTLFIFSIFFLPIYAIARLLLLGEAFATLRYLPPRALAVVDWLSFLPHI